VVDNAVYHMSISLFIPEIFAFKVKSCPKSCRILDVLRYPKFYGGVVPPQKKLYARYQSHLALRHVAKFH